MYQRARKFAVLRSNSPEHFLSLGELQLEAYIVSINALSLIDPKSAWIVLPSTPDTANEVGACVINAHIPILIDLLATVQKTSQSDKAHTREQILRRKARC